MFKKYQCRYFDSRGQSLKPPCSQGDSCRFVHPEDPNWPGLKPMDKRVSSASSAPHRASEIIAWGKTKFSPGRKAYSPDRHPERRSAPLVSQNDLFQKCKIKTGEIAHENHGRPPRGNHDHDQGQNHARGRGSKNGREYRSRNHSASSSKPEHRPLAKQISMLDSSTSENKKGELNACPIDGKTEDLHISRYALPSFGERDNNKNAYPSSQSSFSLVPAYGTTLHESAGTGGRGDRILGLIRDLSRLCHQATQDLEDQAREEKKLKAYTELASTLSKVSETAANPVMPALADILLKHAQCKQRAEDNFKSMGEVWAEAFNTFVVEISHAIDVKLETAMRAIRQETDNLHNALDTTSSFRVLKRRQSEHSRSTSSAENGTENTRGEHNEVSFATVYDDATRDQKRRRLDLASPELGQKGRVKQTGTGVQSEIQDILSQMKSKIDEQAQTLQKLAKENNELKASLHQQDMPEALPQGTSSRALSTPQGRHRGRPRGDSEGESAHFGRY